MPGDKWCLGCGVRLRRIRHEIETEPSLPSNQKKRGGGRRGPTCCALGCYQPREKGEAFCSAHQDEGYVPEAA